MKPGDFNREARRAFGALLTPLGFESQESKQCTFYRRRSEDLYHFVMPSIGRGDLFRIHVFAHSPILALGFDELFPDDLGIPTRACYLGPNGVGRDQYSFACQTSDHFVKEFQSTVADLLKTHALPYLEQFETLEHFLPAIQSPLARAFAIHHVDGLAAARDLLEVQRERFADSQDAELVAVVRHIDGLLSP